MNERLRRAMADGGVHAPDHRGLMPLGEARQLMASASAFRKGEHRQVDGAHVLDSDRLWAALLSLEDAAELVETATALRWEMQPRGFDNTDLWLRYGEGIVPWLRTRLRDEILINNPWCVIPCLLACSSDRAFELAWDARATVVTGKRTLLDLWLERHPEAGIDGLLAKAEAGNRRAAAHLAAAAARGIADKDHVDGAHGILALLDACALGLMHPNLERWPTSPPRDLSVEPLRLSGLIGAREGWGLVIERPQGRGRISQVLSFVYGSAVPGMVTTEVTRSTELASDDALRRMVALGDATVLQQDSVPQLSADLPSQTRLVVQVIEAIAQRH